MLNHSPTMDGGMASDVEREEEEAVTDLLRDRFRLSTITIAEAEAKQCGMEVSLPIITCISDLAFKFAEQLAKDLELFAQHAGRKSVNMEDVILSAHRNDHLASSLRVPEGKIELLEIYFIPRTLRLEERDTWKQGEKSMKWMDRRNFWI
ncbi:hypothetical protein K7X08_013508 [Anisodus acutangulus]|uniref:Centromere protein S n=1 Tax=Anisodus acutangulus TaxID=402998 RepID=A0A9Q1LKB7_9SOLA|nr:hypothetical protein K7X08_013508 [Anisodus acutangulus]